MNWIIIAIVVVIGGIAYFSYITMRDFGSVNKYGGLKNKYAVFIGKIWIEMLFTVYTKKT